MIDPIHSYKTTILSPSFLVRSLQHKETSRDSIEGKKQDSHGCFSCFSSLLNSMSFLMNQLKEALFWLRDHIFFCCPRKVASPINSDSLKTDLKSLQNMLAAIESKDEKITREKRLATAHFLLSDKTKEAINEGILVELAKEKIPHSQEGQTTWIKEERGKIDLPKICQNPDDPALKATLQKLIAKVKI